MLQVGGWGGGSGVVTKVTKQINKKTGTTHKAHTQCRALSQLQPWTTLPYAAAPFGAAENSRFTGLRRLIFDLRPLSGTFQMEIAFLDL